MIGILILILIMHINYAYAYPRHINHAGTDVYIVFMLKILLIDCCHACTIPAAYSLSGECDWSNNHKTAKQQPQVDGKHMPNGNFMKNSFSEELAWRNLPN